MKHLSTSSGQDVPFVRTILLVLFGLLLAMPQTFGQKQMELLDRGVVAVRTAANSVYVGWRLLGTDDPATAFNVYRDGTKINSTPLTASTNLVDNTSVDGLYTVKAVVNGEEQEASKGVSPWQKDFHTIDLVVPAGGTTKDNINYTYTPNDASAADLDGDGEYEIVMLWNPTNAKDNSQSGYTGNVYIDAYQMDGTQMWRIDLGKNIRAGAHYTHLMVYDFDGNGKAEVALRTADGTVSGTGEVIGDANADYTNSNGYVLAGPEFLTVFNGETGAIEDTKDFIPARGSVNSWGDGYGNRVDRFLATVAYLDGERPSLVTARGYYTRLVRVAWDFSNGTLTERWTFDSNDPGNGAYFGQGNHQLTVGDVDGDGKDEVINGASAIDDDGTGLYAGRLGDGDAMHLSDIDPTREGQELWIGLESASQYGDHGLQLRDAATGAEIWGIPTNGADVGRAMSADIDGRYIGMETWGSRGGIYSAQGQEIVGASKPSMSFALWWDGDVQRELLDGTKLDKWNSNSLKAERLKTFYLDGAESINGSKNNPNLSADLFGDWREEVVFRSADNTKLLVFTTTIPAQNRFYTFMHDPQYRAQVAQQPNGYNQPPHTSFYFGGGMDTPPQPDIYVVDPNNLSTGSPKNKQGVIYPNPSQYEFIIQAPGKFSYAVTDLLGKVVDRGTGEQTASFGHRLSSGIYLVTLTGQGRQQTIKVIKK